MFLKVIRLLAQNSLTILVSKLKIMIGGPMWHNFLWVTIIGPLIVHNNLRLAPKFLGLILTSSYTFADGCTEMSTSGQIRVV